MLDDYIADRCGEFDSIDADRRIELLELAEVLESHRGGDVLPVVFICTHNSRRSQMAQVWAHIAARRRGVRELRSYSGGTEVTAFNGRAVGALRRAGVSVDGADGGMNPRYLVGAPGDGDPLECFSKVFDDPSNPQENFVAVMTCSQADKACPYVAGAATRFPLTYVDPKAFDGTERETAAYDGRCAEIARDMLFLFQQLEGGS